MKLTLTKALQLKNRIAEKLSKVSSNIRNNNSGIADRTKTVDVQAAMIKRDRLVKAMVSLKTALQKANTPIFEHIFMNAERRSTIAFLSSLPTQEGPQERMIRFGAEERMLNFTSEIKQSEVEEMISTLETELDEAQEIIDRHNYSVSIDVQDDIKELLK